MIVNLWRYRGFILKHAANDLRYRYAGSAIGIFWNVLNPLLQILIFTLVFSRIMVVKIPTLSSVSGFAIYLCAGLLPWLAFVECVQRGANAFIENANYLKKLPIPEQVFVAQAAMSATLGLGISMGLLLAVNLVLGGRFALTWLCVPVILILLQGFGFGIGLLASTLNVFFRDIGQIVGICMQLWMWVTPIVYVKEILPERLQPLIAYNPAYPFVDALHRSILFGEWPAWEQWPLMLGWALGAPLLGYLVLRQLRSEIRDVV